MFTYRSFLKEQVSFLRVIFLSFCDFRNLLIFIQFNVKNCNPSRQISSKALALQLILSISGAKKLSRAFSDGSLQSS